MKKLLCLTLFICAPAFAQLQMSNELLLVPETKTLIDELMTESPSTALAVFHVLKACGQPVTLPRMKLAARSPAFLNTLREVGIGGELSPLSEEDCSVF